MSSGQYVGLTHTRSAKPVFGSGSAKMDTAPLGAPKRTKSCRAMSVGVIGLDVVVGHQLYIKPIKDGAQREDD